MTSPSPATFTGNESGVGSLFFMNQIILAYKLGFQTLRESVFNMKKQFAANFASEEEHFVYKQIDMMLRHGNDNPNLHSIVKSLEQVTFYSNQAEALFKFFAKDLKLPIIYGFQPFSQKENYPIDQSTRMGCVSLNNFKIQCVEQPGLNKIRGYISYLFTLLFGERVVGPKKEEENDRETLFSLDGIAKLFTSFGSVHTFGLLGISLVPSISGDSDRKLLKSRGLVCTSQFKHYHEFFMTKSMLSKLKLEDKEKKIIGFKQTFLFGSMWEFYRKYIYRNEPFKNHGIYTISYHPFFEIIMKLVTEKHVKYVRNNRNVWQLKNFPLGTLKIKSVKEIEFQTTAIREDVEGLKTFIKLFGSQNVEVIEPYRHYVWDFSKMVSNTTIPPKLRVICRDRSEISESGRVYGLSRMVLEVESLDQVQYQLSTNKINFNLETDTIIIKHHPLLQNVQINLVE